MKSKSSLLLSHKLKSNFCMRCCITLSALFQTNMCVFVIEHYVVYKFISMYSH